MAAADLFTKYNCTNCQDDITGIRVHCAECENFDLCLQCFAAGAEIGQHQNSHAYQFMDTGTSILSVFRGKGAWTAREEIRLLDAIEQYGFGNWEDISKHIETKSAEDAKEEYVNKFINGTIGRHTWTPAQTQRPKLVDHTAEDTGPLGATALQRLPPLDITTEEATQLGYMPNRDGFEREYDPTAEQLISTLSMNADDIEGDYLLKLAQVDMYTRRLRERVRRKRLVRDYQLVANFFRNRNYAQHPGMSREQKEFRDRFRVFAQFYTANEYERLLGSLEREKELRIRLSELYRYRHNGLTKIDDCRHFEQHIAVVSRSTGPYGHGKTDNTLLSTGSHQLPGSSSHFPMHSNKRAEHSNGNDANSSLIVPKSTHHIADPISYAALSHSKNYLGSCRGLSALTTTTTPTTMMNTTQTLKANNSQQHQLQQQLPYPPPLQQLQLQKNLPQLQVNDVLITNQLQQQTHAENKNQSQQENNFNINNNNNYNNQNTKSNTTPMSNIVRAQLEELNHLPYPLGSDQLSANEKQLCKMLGLTPTSYLSLKTALLSGMPISAQPTQVESTLHNFFVKVGWIRH